MPRLRGFWWETMTPLAADCEIALEKLGCTPGEYYQRTTGWRERLIIRLHLAYRAEQDQAAQEHQERLRESRERARPGPQQRPFRE